jgi:hypothetical protein
MVFFAAVTYRQQVSAGCDDVFVLVYVAYRSPACATGMGVCPCDNNNRFSHRLLLLDHHIQGRLVSAQGNNICRVLHR